VRYRIQRYLAPLADRIVCNAESGRAHIIAKGFPVRKIEVVPNGIRTDYFRFSESGRNAVRSEWGVRDDELLVGMVARLDPIKDHRTFLAAAAHVAAVDPDVRFVCVGTGPKEYGDRLRHLAEQLLAPDRILWVGNRGDMPSVYSALDLLVLTSLGEGFPNVVGEAMACGVPCVTTDVGDCARIINSTGSVVPRGNDSDLSQAVQRHLRHMRSARLGARNHCRARINEQYSVDAMIEQTLRVFRECNPQPWSVA
jgi:glycosyltransferase involved in cell wall biosynthesis